MNRRGFLSLFASVPIAAALAEPLIARVERTIFLPPAGGWTANRETNIFYRGENLTEAGVEWLLDQRRKTSTVERASYLNSGFYVPRGQIITTGGLQALRANAAMRSNPAADWRGKWRPDSDTWQLVRET